MSKAEISEILYVVKIKKAQLSRHAADTRITYIGEIRR
jgi:hypothetical protein